MQNETVFYAAVSSDGFLAGPNGDMTWAEKRLAGVESSHHLFALEILLPETQGILEAHLERNSEWQE